MNRTNIFLGVGVVVAIILAIIGIGSHKGISEQRVAEISAQVAQQINQGQPVQLGGITNYDQIGIGPLIHSTQLLTIGSGTSTAVFTNNTTHTLFAAMPWIFRDGVASTTMGIRVEATTSPFIALNNLVNTAAPAWATSTLVNNFYFATGTLATSTSSFNEVARPPSSRAVPYIPVLAGQSLIMWLTEQSGQPGGISQTNATPCTGAILSCEQSTSTNRGFNVYGMVELFSTSTVPNNRIE